MKKIFITENAETFLDEIAAPMLKDKNDLEFFDHENNGIHKVSEQRWKIAQKYEKTGWMERDPNANDDRNFDHFERFDFLNSIKDQLFQKKSIIELGCGPFTNLRLFSNMLNNPEITLLDPLVNDYVNLKNCSYNTGSLNGFHTNLVCSSIEEFDLNKDNISNKFDIVVMVNVIEHCFDVDIIFDKIIEILNDDGIFIFSDVYFNNVYDLASQLYDAGHPIRLSEQKLNKFLQKFKFVFDKRFHQLYGQEWRNDIYFIGRK